MTRARFAFWLILCLALVVTGWWLCFVPDHPHSLYAAIPVEAEYISVSRDVAARWDTFLQNPLTRSLVISLGAAPEELDDLSQDPDLRFWMQKLFSDEVVVANVPAHAFGQDDTWIITTWLGGRSLRYRWLMPWIKDRRLTRIGQHEGHALWRYDTRKWDFPYPLYFAFVEGGMIGCMSPHASTIQYVLDTYDGRTSFGVKPFVAWMKAPSDELDRGWIRLPPDADWPACTYALSDIGSNTISGSVGIEAPWLKPGVTLSALNTNTLGRLLGDLPMAAVVFPLDMSHTEWMNILPVETRKVLLELTAATQPRVVVAALMGDEYSGRFKGLKLPGVVLGIQMQQPGPALKNAQDAIDRLNAAYKWGLIAGRYPVGEHAIYVIESTGDTAYALFNASECMAFAVVDDWFLLAGSSETLRRLVARYQQPAALIEARAGRWGRAFDPELCAGFGWLDLLSGGKAIRNAIAAWSLKLMFEDAGNSQRQRQQLNEIRAWLEGLGSMETCWIWMNTDEGRTTFRFQMGSN
ncbi:MAG: hypothetical protein EOM20_07695 [Spartobacteria bacterium]|nr:hypothetical protein [Spartobacteria bacterium]